MERTTPQCSFLQQTLESTTSESPLHYIRLPKIVLRFMDAPRQVRCPGCRVRGTCRFKLPIPFASLATSIISTTLEVILKLILNPLIGFNSNNGHGWRVKELSRSLLYLQLITIDIVVTKGSKVFSDPRGEYPPAFQTLFPYTSLVLRSCGRVQKL